MRELSHARRHLQRPDGERLPRRPPKPLKGFRHLAPAPAYAVRGVAQRTDSDELRRADALVLGGELDRRPDIVREPYGVAAYAHEPMMALACRLGESGGRALE